MLAPGEHHDGFSNWDSVINPYNAKNYDPHRDLVGDLMKAVEEPRKGYTPQDIRFKRHSDTLYAVVMSWPASEAVITLFAVRQAPTGKVEKVELLGHPGGLAVMQDAAGLHVKFPAEKPCEYVYALRITGLTLDHL